MDVKERTAKMREYARARNVAYEAAGDYVQGIRFSPLLDVDTTSFCRALVGRSIHKEDPHFERMVTPPYHNGCRTITVPITVRDEGWEFDTDWDQWLEKHWPPKPREASG